MPKPDTSRAEGIGRTVSPNQPRTPMQTFRLPENLRAQLRAAAEREGVTVTDLLRRLVEDYLASSPPD